MDAADATYNGIQNNIDKYIEASNIEAPSSSSYQAIWHPNTKNEESINYKEEEEEGIKSIVWATGFKVNSNWIEFSHVFDQQGFPIYKRGVLQESGLYFIGLPWLHTWGSGRFSHVGQGYVH